MTCPARGYASAEAGHPSEDLLERYVIGVVRDESELAPLEEHLLACPSCVARTERMEDYIWSIYGLNAKGNFEFERVARYRQEGRQ